MPCIRIDNGFICSFVDHGQYICFEHTTYWFEFSQNFGPYFFRIEKGKEIDIMDEFDFDENNDYVCTSNKFLWDFFDEWHDKYLRDKDKN